MSLRRGHCDLSLEAGDADVLRKSHHEHVFDLDPSSTDQWAPPLTLRYETTLTYVLRATIVTRYVHVHVSVFGG